MQHVLCLFILMFPGRVRLEQTNGQINRECHTNLLTLARCVDNVVSNLTRFNKIATQGAPQMAVDKEANSLSRVYSYYSKFNLLLFYV